MASDGSPGAITGVSPVIGIQASAGKALPQSGKSASTAAASIPTGNVLPQGGKSTTIVAASSAAVSTATSSPAANDATALKGANAPSTAGTTNTDVKSASVSRSDPQTLVDQVNKFLNDSGRPDEFRVDPSSANYIQQVNPSTGAVVAEYSVSEFPALARSVGASGLLIDDIA